MGQWQPNDLTVKTKGPLATYDPAAYLFAQNTQHVIYQGFTPEGGETGHLHELHWDEDSDAWHDKDLTSEVGAPPATSSPAAYAFATQGSQHVLYVGELFDGHVHELWWDEDDGWNHHDLTGATGAALTLTIPAGYEFHGEGTQHVVYQSQNNHIWELWWQSDSGWHSGDVTATVGAPPAGGPPTGYAFEGLHTQHVFYKGQDSHIHELWWDAPGNEHLDLTALTGAPPASGDPSGYVFRPQGTQHVDYRGVDGHVHELWWRYRDGWHHNDLTDATGAPPADQAMKPVGYGFDPSALQPVATQHVDYVGTDGHVHELWWDPSGWHHNDLTLATAAPAAISDTAAYVFTEQSSQHVFFTSDDHHVIELVWTPS